MLTHSLLLFAVHIKATLERSLRQLDTDTDRGDSPLVTFENETLFMALGLLGSLAADAEQVFHDMFTCQWLLYL